jgi:hypothetical protein
MLDLRSILSVIISNCTVSVSFDLSHIGFVHSLCRPLSTVSMSMDSTCLGEFKFSCLSF